MESGHFSLEESIAAYHRGSDLLRHCQKQLSDAERKIQVFEKGEQTIWECRNCGHLVMGTKAPDICPVCKKSQCFFEIRTENY